MLQTPDGHSRLELVRFQTPPAVPGDGHAPANTLGIRHLTFAVDDVDDVVARLQARGAELVGEIEDYEDTYRLCYIRGPEGIIVEMAEQIGSWADTRTRLQLLFVQGGGRGVHAEWDNKLVESLRRELGQSYEIHYPHMPSEDDPSYALWRTTLERELRTLGDSPILVAHSVGGTILLGVLAEHAPARKFGAIFLIAAPFAGDGGWPSDDLQFHSDLGARLPKGVPTHFYHGLEDEVVPPAHVDLYAQAVPQAHIHRLRGRDHQLNNDLSEVAGAILSLEATR